MLICYFGSGELKSILLFLLIFSCVSCEVSWTTRLLSVTRTYKWSEAVGNYTVITGTRPVPPSSPSVHYQIKRLVVGLWTSTTCVIFTFFHKDFNNLETHGPYPSYKQHFLLMLIAWTELQLYILYFFICHCTCTFDYLSNSSSASPLGEVHGPVVHKIIFEMCELCCFATSI